MSTIDVMISQEVLDDPPALARFLNSQFAKGYTKIQLPRRVLDKVT